MKKISSKTWAVIASLATVFAAFMASSACWCFIYQPEEPKSLQEK